MERSECPDFADLSACIDGELGADRRIAVEEHLRGCDECRHQVGELHSVSRAMRASLEGIAAIDVVEQVRWRVSEQSRDVARRYSAFGLVPLALTASLILGVGVTLGSRLASPVPSADLWTAARMAPFVAVPPGNVCLNYPSCYLR